MKMKWIIIIVVVVMLLAGVVAGTLLFMQDNGDGTEETAREDKTEQTAAESRPAIYKEIEPAILVNFSGENQTRYRYLQVGIKVMGRDQNVMQVIDEHMPAIRNNLILLFSDQEPDKLTTREGKVALSHEVKKTLQELVDKELGQAATGDGNAAELPKDRPQIEAVYFTNFVMQ